MRRAGIAAPTIAAIATPTGRGGVGIVRISGTALVAVATTLAGRPVSPRRALRATFRDAAGRAIDDGLVLYFPAPHSYTGEDVIELHGHGGPVVMNLLLGRAVELGARLAEPGEFTRRAFLNEKLDLAQAEAVADLIDASSASAARSALRSLRGEFSVVVQMLVRQLIELRALTEATLDFPEDEIDPVHHADARARLAAVQAALASALERGRQGSLLRTGLHVVIAGQPNVGKSSLLNRLAGDEVAIVTPIAGTTRDTIRQTLQIDGVPIHIIDTAGLRDSVDDVERIGIARTWREIERADAILLIVDARDGLTAGDDRIAAQFPARVPTVVVHNKADLAGVAAGSERRDGTAHIQLSALTGEGVALLERELLAIAGWQPGAEDVFLARERHLQALEQARGHLHAAAPLFDQSELFAEELRLAQAALAAITGEFTADDLLGEIFSRFCIGK